MHPAAYDEGINRKTPRRIPESEDLIRLHFRYFGTAKKTSVRHRQLRAQASRGIAGLVAGLYKGSCDCEIEFTNLWPRSGLSHGGGLRFVGFSLSSFTKRKAGTWGDDCVTSQEPRGERSGDTSSSNQGPQTPTSPCPATQAFVQPQREKPQQPPHKVKHFFNPFLHQAIASERYVELV